MFHVERRAETEKHPGDLAFPLEVAHRGADTDWRARRLRRGSATIGREVGGSFRRQINRYESGRFRRAARPSMRHDGRRHQ
jgi:hypothetical protein